MEDKRKYHIIIGSKAYFDASLPDFSEEDEVDTFLELVKAFGCSKTEPLHLRSICKYVDCQKQQLSWNCRGST